MKTTILALALSLSTSAFAGGCDALYPNNTPIVVADTVEICNSFYVSIYNPKTKAVMLTSEIVKPHSGRQARVNSFRPDTRLVVGTRAELSDYSKSGFDKGHMVPAGDATTADEMRETFLLSNMTPQVPALNRTSWREMEEMIRRRVDRGDEGVHAITGAVYSTAVGGSRTVGRRKIPVPDAYFKIVYFKTGAIAFYANNTEDASIKQTNVKDLITYSGVMLPE